MREQGLWMAFLRTVTFNANWAVVGDPVRGAHFVFISVISVAPLLVGAWVISRRR